MLTTFGLELKESSKPISKKVPMTKFCLTFPDHRFNFVMKKLKKTKKMLISNAQNIPF